MTADGKAIHDTQSLGHRQHGAEAGSIKSTFRLSRGWQRGRCLEASQSAWSPPLTNQSPPPAVAVGCDKCGAILSANSVLRIR